MKGKFGLLFCLLSVIILYSINVGLFWLAVGNTLIHISASFAYSFFIARPSMIKYEEAVLKMLEEGASQAEIDALETFPVESDHAIVPKWTLVLSMLTFLISILLLIIGLINWIK